jgi:energy-coupling factor transporter ATP-binding protein EcfA2
MRIISVTLKDCKRLLLKNIQYIKLTPKEAIQIILGRNGSGKSSLVKLMTPLPPDPSSFAKSGFVEFVAFKNGSTYECKSTFSPSTKHSFKKDGVQLNDGGTTRVQLELVKEHFGITPMIHDLMTGNEKFNSMSPQRRRIWITLLCDTSYDFALSAYDLIRERHRDISGALKLNKKNLVVETAKVISSEEEARLETEVNALLKELEILAIERAPLPKPVGHYLSVREEALKEADALAMRVFRLKVVAPLAYNDGRIERDDWGAPVRVAFQSVEEIEREVDRLRHLATTHETIINECTQRHEKELQHYDILIRAGEDGVLSLTKQIHELDQEKQELLNKCTLPFYLTDPIAAQRAFEAIVQPLSELLEQMPVNADRKLGKDNLRLLHEKQYELENNRNVLQQELQRLRAKKDHADEHRSSGKQTCPQCHHSFVVGIKENEYNLVVERIATHAETLAEMDKLREKYRSDIKEIEDYFTMYREYMGFTKNVMILEPFWVHLMTTRVITDSPKNAIQQIRLFQRDLEFQVQAAKLSVKTAELEKLRHAAEQAGDASLQEVKSTLDKLTAQLGEMTQKLSGVRQSINEYLDYRRLILQGQGHAERIKNLLTVVDESERGYIEATRLESIADCIGQIQQTLVLKQEALRHIKMQKAIVLGLESQVNSLSIQEEASKMMVNALSPTHGLIAEGLLGFIRNFVGQMNKFIKSIWSYPFQIIPPGYNAEGDGNGTELDYKFKMIVGEYSNVVPDVGLGSDGQKEIVDMSFKMVALHYLNLADMPLLLDEFGRALDEEHRFSANEAIKTLMNHRDLRQIFIVSHYAESYEGFSNADICLLDRENVILSSSKNYNKHVEFA